MPQRFGVFITEIYHATTTGDLNHSGTGFFVATRNKYWIVTATHVLLPHDRPYYIWVGRNVYQLGAAVVLGEKFDCAIIELPVSVANSLRKMQFTFLPYNVVTNHSDISKHCMCVCGYPEESVRLEPGDTGYIVSAQPVVITSTFYSPEQLRMNRCDPHIDVAGRFKQFFVDGKPRSKVVMNGLSGGPIWVQWSKNSLNIVAVAREFDPKRKIIIGSRIYPLFLVLFQLYPKERAP